MTHSHKNTARCAVAARTGETHATLAERMHNALIAREWLSAEGDNLARALKSEREVALAFIELGLDVEALHS